MAAAAECLEGIWDVLFSFIPGKEPPFKSRTHVVSQKKAILEFTRGPHMSFEVEVKYRLFRDSDLAARLAENGIEPEPAVVYEDTYLEHPARKLARTNEAFRIRKAGDSIQITYKGPRRRGLIKTREEIELSLGNGPGDYFAVFRLFRILGFRQVVIVRKTRQPYLLIHHGRTLEVALDFADGIGAFAEIETIAETESDLPYAQRAVLDLAASLGLTEIETRSYRRMAEERESKDHRKMPGSMLAASNS
jgi:adenylate cyclase class 2